MTTTQASATSSPSAVGLLLPSNSTKETPLSALWMLMSTIIPTKEKKLDGKNRSNSTRSLLLYYLLFIILDGKRLFIYSYYKAIEIKRYLFLEGLYHVHEQGLPCRLHLIDKGRCFVARCLCIYHYRVKYVREMQLVKGGRYIWQA